MVENLIDKKIKSYQQAPSFQVNRATQSMQTSAQINDNAVNSTPSQDTYDKPPEKNNESLYILGTWLGLNKLTDLYNKSCSGKDYNKTLVGRFGNFGDKLSVKVSSNPIGASIGNAFSTMKNNTKTFINKSSLLSAMFNTPTKPENSFVTGFLETQRAADLSEATSVINSYLDKMPNSLKEAGATKAEIQALKAKYGTNFLGKIKNESRAIQELQFNRVGAKPNCIDIIKPDKVAETLKRLKVRHLGLDPNKYKEVLSNPHRNEKAIIEACKRGGENAKSFSGRMFGFLTKNTKDLSMSHNKLITESKHASKLGKLFAKAPKTFMRGLTFGGGLMGTLMVAFGLGKAFHNASKAPKDQKVGTAVGGTVEAASWVVSMPLALKMMHSGSGMQYAGMSKMDVGRYRVALRNFNKTAKASGFADKAAYDSALAAVNKLKVPKGAQSKLTKGMSKVGKFLGIALESPQPFKEATKTLTGGAKMAARGRNLKRLLPLLGKNIIGYPLRFALYAAVCSPIVDKVISSVTTKMFGKPYEPEEENETKNESDVSADSQDITNSSMNVQNQNVNQIINNEPLDIDSLPDDNLIKQKLKGEDVMNPEPYIPSEDFVPSNNVGSKYDTEPRSYIPSEVPPPPIGKEASANSAVTAAIAKADLSEAKALEVLNGIY